MPSPLLPNTRVKAIAKENEDIPELGEAYSFLKAAMRMKRQGPVDFSENVHAYLNAGKLDNHDIDNHEAL
ncbi:MAG: hypothetical protein U1F76_00135 [Candidatus Competibacteraceae bacterium]